MHIHIYVYTLCTYIYIGIHIWFSFFDGESTSMGYLMPNPSLQKNTNNTIFQIAGKGNECS